MAKSQAASTKKEKEKQKQQKKREKEQRKEERRANAKEGKTLDEMLAYVDENGNLTSTPPDPTKKQTINVEDIAIGATKKEEEAPDQVHTGIVTYFNSSKGYGFIKDARSKESIFVHTSSLTTPVKENDKVSFHTERGHRGTVAVQVKKI
jgi:cold shock CspA family protein